jgi:hypothetical protein
MALTVEDGSGLANANSYLSVADADTYNTNHTNSTDWGNASTAEKEQALRRATQYIDMMYGARWKGIRVYETQALAWPRANVTDYDGYLIDHDEMPQKLKDACAEAAERLITEEMMPDQSDTGTVKSRSVRVGPISESLAYTDGDPSEKAYPKVDKLLRELLQTTGLIRRA